MSHDFSLDPDSDPLGVLLMIDHFALRSDQHQFLIRLFDEWEVSTVIACVTMEIGESQAP